MANSSSSSRDRLQHSRNENWMGFIFKANYTTMLLLYLVEGINRCHHERQSHRLDGSLPQISFNGQMCYPPSLNNLSNFPIIYPFNVDKILHSEGDAAQLAYKGWVVDIYSEWEVKFRRDSSKLAQELGEEGYIPLEIDVIGDLRHIRNDLVHTGIATEEHTGKCRVLNWYSVGDKIALSMNHVFDFLNHLGAFSLTYNQDGSQEWFPFLLDEQFLLNRSGERKLVSIRRSHEKDGKAYYCGVFDDGVVLKTILTSDQLKGSKEVEVSKSGDLVLPNRMVVSPTGLYQTTVKKMFARYKAGIRNKDRSPGIGNSEDDTSGPWGPWIKFRQ